jgi:hypothetical protein
VIVSLAERFRLIPAEPVGPDAIAASFEALVTRIQTRDDCHRIEALERAVEESPERFAEYCGRSEYKGRAYCCATSARLRVINPKPRTPKPKRAIVAGSGTCSTRKARISPPGKFVVWMFK